ncbi:MAG: hypothetical protein NTX79_00865 [Candidatus Micrarchaeota archaeon]|nr:hypothetical protein [Candidatus Micrarchaeota archaeon]
MYVTAKKLQNLGLTAADIPTGFRWKSNFRADFDAVMKKKAETALFAIKGDIKSLINVGALPKDSRVGVRGMCIDGKNSYVLSYIETESGKEYLVLQVNISLGTLGEPKGKITASTYWDGFRQFVDDTLDNIEPVKVKIVGKLKEYSANRASYPPRDGTQEVSMAFAEGII